MHIFSEHQGATMHVTRLAATMFFSIALTAPLTTGLQAEDLMGDPERGKTVYRSTGDCMRCHGWPADGKTGVHLRAPPGSNLRDSTLDAEALAEVVRCGRPGTPMPYHDRQAYRDEACYGMTMSDFDEDDRPVQGKTIRDEDIANVVAYLQEQVIGRGKPTLEECGEFFDDPEVGACDFLRQR
jgi:mono/diheme cytochrome c family protein